jgi:hypothetical protein
MAMKARLGLIFWWIVFLFILLSPVLLILSSGQAQDGMQLEDLELDSDLGLPFEMDHPDTGEPGVWIPRWVEREHLIDANKLALCIKDATFFELELEAVEQRHADVMELIGVIEESRDEARDEALTATKSLIKAESRLERRLRAVWGLVGASVVLAGTTTLFVLR